ncbi:hypothetical protein TSTA_066450 [Talaromyces stipitatus ATCC 10500]|uniref:Uncharacterized protein n=1 Tax=Talaromyces stipitatus (strain ATCC 10500 / CBS 375.48 / QM 6759 / NRRL 1006) TaxID=441959 RepID=B8LXB7_TALSN|nr:uncharacterized protein TSTA_066450 [Talaromyces stipitatus ATCC 10500]EED23198.1 hypothetical protein TSTA_066450 [Talaromyces stipitatus ATCC 10500]
MFCLPPLSIFSFWSRWLAFMNDKPSLEDDLVSVPDPMDWLKHLSDCVQEEGIAEIGVLEKVEIETLPAKYEGDHTASFWLHPRRLQDVPRIDGFYKATVRYDSKEYKVERYGQIPWSAKGSLPVSIPYAEAKTLIPDLPELPPNIFAAIFNSLIRR